MATERLKKAAALIGSATDVAKIEAALIEAGYGEKYAAGYAPVFRELLASEGLLAKGRPASPAPATKEA